MTNAQLDAERLQRLLEAGRALTASLDLGTVLDGVLATARELTGARYAALGILDDTRTELAQFLTSGIDPAAHRAIGDLPRGRGVLGLLIEDPHPLRLPDVTAHPRSYGFPPGHPDMGAFLGVPVIIRGEAWGNLYLTEKEGGAAFDDTDELSVLTLADWAAIAIENARLYESADRRRAELERAVRGLEATTAIARAVGGETRIERVLELIAKRGRALVGARRIGIALLDGDQLQVVARAGEAEGEGSTERALIERVVHTGRAERTAEELLVPLTYRARTLGVLGAVGRVGEGGAFGPEDEQLLNAFAASAATAVATAQTVERDRLRHAIRAAEDERARWARELHDETLQGLAALRVGLAAASRSDDAEALREAMRAAVEQIAGEVQNLRAIISDLRPAALDQLGLGPALEALAQRVGPGNGLEIAVDASSLGPLDHEVETTVYRLAQEALTNVAKHAAASHVAIEVGTADGRVTLSVADDGRGFDPGAATAGFGLLGMRERAALAGGSLDVASSADGGTVVTASLPVA